MSISLRDNLGRIKKLTPDKYNNCLSCNIKFLARKIENRKGITYYSYFCSQACSHKYQVGKNHASWKRGYHIAHGYQVNSETGKYIHREIMEKALNRKLGTKEIVHHINHNSLDNRLENLELTNPSDHIIYHLRENLKKPEYRKKLSVAIQAAWDRRRGITQANQCRWCGKGRKCTCGNGGEKK